MPEPLPSDFVTKCRGRGEWLRCPDCSVRDVQAPILACLKCKSTDHPTRLCLGLEPAGGCIECGVLGGFHHVACSRWGYPPNVASADSDAVIETVDHPQHYGGPDNPHEVILCLAAWGLLSNACLFNVVKYVARTGKKPGVDMLRDLRAARWYLDYEIRRVENGGTE